jgi:hypothetical protein
MSLDSSAALTRAARLPPVSSGTFNMAVVVRVADCVSSTLTSMEGLGSTPACVSRPSLAAASFFAAAKPGFRSSAAARARSSVSTTPFSLCAVGTEVRAAPAFCADAAADAAIIEAARISGIADTCMVQPGKGRAGNVSRWVRQSSDRKMTFP